MGLLTTKQKVLTFFANRCRYIRQLLLLQQLSLVLFVYELNVIKQKYLTQNSPGSSLLCH